MTQTNHYHDNSVAPIIAFDFDETICINSYPNPFNGTIRSYAKEVINFLVDIGCKVVIWTSRDIAVDQETFEVHDDLTIMLEWLAHNGVKYSAVNRSIQFAPFKYNPRKIYAHMYVDDRAFGWYENSNVLLTVFTDVLVGVLGIPESIARVVWCDIYYRKESSHIEYIKDVVRNWNRT